MINLKEIEIATKGKILNGENTMIPLYYKIDSREIEQNDFFIPIVGENTDGHQYILDCVQKGCSGFFIESKNTAKEYIIKEAKRINTQIGIIEVENSEKALYEAAKYNREKHIDIPVIAITGSVGKTSTREMIASVLSEEKKLLVTQKNYNSCIGAPIMILQMEDQDVCVLEAGMNHKGEMELLSELLKPDICVVTNIGNAHIGLIGSKENIFYEKVQITKEIKGIKKVIVNGDDKFLSQLHSNEKYSVKKYYENEAVDTTQTEYGIHFRTKIYEKEEEIIINQIGNHNVFNALAAIKVAEILNIESKNIVKGIAKYKNYKGRLEKKYMKNNILLIDDTYNASIDSMKSGLFSVNEFIAKRKIAVLGDMMELGKFSKKLHMQVGEVFKEINFDKLYVYGELSQYIAQTAKKYLGESNVYLYCDRENLIQDLRSDLKEGDVVYFKASNSMRFSEIIEALQK